MKLYGTGRSHFTRKIRLLLDHWHVPYTLIDVGDVSSIKEMSVAGSPAALVPVLEHNGERFFDSDHIALALSLKFDKANQYQVRTEAPIMLNARAIMNSVMLADVRLVLGKRSGLETEGLKVFENIRKTIPPSLHWLDARTDIFSTNPLNYAACHLVSMWDHLNVYHKMTSGDYKYLVQTVSILRQSPIVRRSEPPPV